MSDGESDLRGGLLKARTGITGLDEITGGGLPQGRATLVCGAAGCGKTLLAMEFLVRGALQFGEPGLFVAFEENSDELGRNVASLGFDLQDLIERKLLSVDHVDLEHGFLEATGGYDLTGLFVRILGGIESVGAARVALDSAECLFGGLPNEGVIRSELRRLFRLLKDRGVTAVVTGERGQGSLTRHGLEEYVADCVILLDHILREHTLTRYLRIIKYRGATHGTNEYPFLIDENGLSVLPITVLGLDHPASLERVSTGVERLDEMLGGQGMFRGSSVLITGTAGTGKTSLAAHCAAASCERGEPCLYFAFEESPEQIIRNMRSIGIDLDPSARSGLLRFHTARPTMHGLEMHLVICHKLVEEFQPRLVIVDPVSSFTSISSTSDARAMLVRLVDFLKSREITAVLTDLTPGDRMSEQTDVGVSSLMDTWILLRTVERMGERKRTLQVLKSRGMAHSNQIREFRLSNRGVDLLDFSAEDFRPPGRSRRVPPKEANP